MKQYIKKRFLYFCRLYNTLRYLKPSQIFLRIFKIPYFIKVFIVSHTINNEGIRKRVSQPTLFINREEIFDGHYFTFLNQKHSIETCLWLNTRASTLWNYNLHYFDWLRQENIAFHNEKSEQLISDWIVQNKVGCDVSWDPYPTSLRVVNWCKSFLLRKNEPCDTVCASLTKQIKWLLFNIEWHILGNHLFANGKAFIFYGLYFDGKFAKQVLNKGICIISEQLKEQILDDGGHFERSPMYHNIITEDVLDLINISQCYPNVLPNSLLVELNAAARKMLVWSACMTHPDGGVAYFNDSVDGISPKHDSLVRYAKNIGLSYQNNDSGDRITKLLPSGYLRYTNTAADVMIDVGPVGPDYQPGHTHADTLSFEASIKHQRVIVNSGISGYALGSQRMQERGTAAHNTVSINNINSSDVWGSFRVGRRAYPTILTMEKNFGLFEVYCSHNGYDNLPNSPKHFRKFYLEQGAITVIDEIEGNYDTASGFLNVHPDLDVYKLDVNNFEIRMSNKPICEIAILRGKPEVIEGFFCKGFGNRVSSHSIKLDFMSKITEFKITY